MSLDTLPRKPVLLYAIEVIFVAMFVEVQHVDVALRAIVTGKSTYRKNERIHANENENGEGELHLKTTEEIDIV